MNDVVYLSVDDLALLADRNGFVVRDIGLVAAAAARPQTSVFGEDAYPTLQSKAAVLIDSISNTQPLLDGNKRLALRSVQVFLRLNGNALAATQDEAYDLIMAASQTPHPTWQELAERVAIEPRALPAPTDSDVARLIRSLPNRDLLAILKRPPGDRP